MEHLIECRNIVKIYRGRGIGGARHGFKALDGVSLSIDRDKSYGLVGESGCGKTTFARALLHLDPPTAGSVVFDGTDLHSLGRREFRKFRKRMQIVFQDPNSALNPKMSIHDSLSEGLINRGIQPEERIRRIKDLLELVGISYSYRNRYPHEFSGGQRQRIGIARALIMGPEFIIADEPISALDVSIRAQVLNLLSQIQRTKGLSLMFIAHDLSVVRFITDRIAVIHLGQIVELGETEEIFSKPLHPYTRALLSAVPLPDPRREKGKKSVPYDPSCHDYSSEAPAWREALPGHFTLGNAEEVEAWTKRYV